MEEGLNNSRSSCPYFGLFVCCIIARNVNALTSLMVTLCEDFLLAFIMGAMRSLSTQLPGYLNILKEKLYVLLLAIEDIKSFTTNTFIFIDNFNHIHNVIM